MDENKQILFSQHRGTARLLLSAIAVACALFALSGCGMDIVPTRSVEGDIENAKSHMRQSKKATREEVAKALEKNRQNTKVAEVRSLPPSTPSRQQKTTYTTHKNLFGVDLRSTNDRLDRLERSVQDMRNDFDNVRPSIKRLMAIEGDIQSLIGELKKLNDDPSLVSSRQSAFRPKPTAPKRTAPASRVTPTTPKKARTRSLQTKTPPPVQGGKASIFDIRVGEHPGKTRIVLDSNTKTSFNIDIDNGERIMVVELPNANWAARNSMNFGRSPFISSFSVEAAGGGSMAIFQLKKGAKIGYKADLDGKGSSRRLVIDLVSG